MHTASTSRPSSAAVAASVSAPISSVRWAAPIPDAPALIAAAEAALSTWSRTPVLRRARVMFKLKELIEMKEKGLIDDDEFKQMMMESVVETVRMVGHLQACWICKIDELSCPWERVT